MDCIKEFNFPDFLNLSGQHDGSRVYTPTPKVSFPISKISLFRFVRLVVQMGPKREIEDIEIDLTAPKPLNKKQKRLLKKGLIEEPQPEDIDASKQPKLRSNYAVWIGNLSFTTSADTLRNFIVKRTADLESPITLDDITRIKLPSRKGFAYVDVKTEEQMEELISLSELRLDNRSLLIKNASSFEGRPEEHVNGQKNPPSRILFVGNLSFDTTDEQIEAQFQHCGEIIRIRTATFQDSGKCKGFTFIDFKDEEGAGKALSDPSCRRMNGRLLRMEYGEDRSKRRPKLEWASSSEPKSSRSEPNHGSVVPSQNSDRSWSKTDRPKKPSPKKVGRARPTPGAALAGAVRSRQEVVASTGKKVVFD